MTTTHKNEADEDVDPATQEMMLCSKTLKHLAVFP
jgi:hypothetical protein